MRFFNLLRSPLFLAALPLISAADTLWSDRAAYCAPPSAILINDFAVTYYRANHSLVFYVSLDSTAPGVNVEANVFINAYEMDLLNRTVDICDLIGGVLCPLPLLNISAYGTFPVPDDVQIPGIAYTVPNLEGWARLTLRQPNGTNALCIETTLTNGLTTEHLAVKIVTGIFTAIALLVGLIHSAANTASPAQYRWFDILFLFQAAAATGFLNLNYPLMYRAFTRNFAWSHALFHSSGMQSSIDSMRYRTGGYLGGNLTSGVEYIDRTSSPSNGYVNINDIIEQVQALANAFGGLGGGLFGRTLAKRQRMTGVTATIANVGAPVLSTTGIPTYTNSVGVACPNAITTIFLFFLAFIGIFLFFHAVAFFAARFGGRNIWAQDLRRKFWLWMGGNALLMCLMWSFPIWIFAFFQFRIGDSGLAIFWGVFAIILVFFPLLFVFIFSILRSRRGSSATPGVSPLYTSYNWFHSAGALYRAYRQKFHWFWFIFVLAIITRSGFIAFGAQSGWAQVIGLMVVEFIVFIALLACRPHKDRKGDWLAPFLSFCRLAAFGLLVAFIPQLGVQPIPRTIIGFVIIVLFGIPVILLFFGLLFNLGYGWLWRKHHDRIEDGLEVQRYAASDESLRPAMVQSSSPVTPRESYHHKSDNSVRQRSSIMEPVSNVYEPHNASPSGYYNDRVDSSDAYAAAASGRRSMPTSRTLSRTGTALSSRQLMSRGSTMRDSRRWSRDQYFDNR